MNGPVTVLILEMIIFQHLLENIRYASVAFKSRDPDGTGFISSSDFEDVLLSIK